MFIDVHTHCLVGSHWGHEWETNWEPVYGGSWKDVTPATYDEAMHGVDLAIVFGMRATAVGVNTPHDYVASFCAQVRTPTIGFMALDPSDEDVIAEMEYAHSLGLRGIKLYPVLAGFDPTSPRHDPFYRRATELKLPLLWHMGTTPSPVGHLQYTQPLLIDEVARRHPDLVQILAHIGHPWQRETLMVLRKHRNVFSDVSGVWSRPFDGYAALVRAQEWDVVDKLLFGSDFPLWTPDEGIAGLRELASLRSGTLPYVRSETVERIIEADSAVLLGLRA